MINIELVTDEVILFALLLMGKGQMIIVRILSKKSWQSMLNI